MTDEPTPEIPEVPPVSVPEPQGAMPPGPQGQPYVPNTGMIPDWVKARTATCPYEGCSNTIDPNVADADQETGTQFCSAHIKSCYDCDEKHSIDHMKSYKTSEYRGDTYWYCNDCYNDRFTTCPNCSEIKEKDDILVPTRGNSYYMKKGGCKECAVECYGCSKIIDKDNAYNENGDDYCENCHSENFSSCEKCGEVYPKDDVTYVENHGEYCDYCYKDMFTTCEDCNETIEKSDAEEVDDEYYCQDCAAKRGPLAYIKYTENFTDFTYTKKDRFINLLYKLLPISVKDLKSKHPGLASGLGDLVKFSNGQALTLDLVKKYRASLKPEDFPVGYTTWDGVQRSIDTLGKYDKPTTNAQLVINVLASGPMLEKLKANPALYDLFDKVNTISDRSTHPYIKDQMGWIRVELDPQGEYILVDEIQCDHSNAGFQLKSAQDYSKVTAIKNVLKEKYTTDDLGVNQLLINPKLQEDDGVKALRAIYKRKYQRTDEELNAILHDKTVKGGIEERLMNHVANKRELAQLLLHKLVPQDAGEIETDIQALREIYKRQGKLNDKQLDESLEKSEFPPELELQEADEKMDEIRDGLKEKYDLDDAGLNNLLAEYTSILNDFPNIASQAVSRFARSNQFKKIFWHTYESGMALKNNAPPKSLYDKTPKENFFQPSENKPFGLDGTFFEKEAKKAQQLYKTARKLYLKYLSVIS